MIGSEPSAEWSRSVLSRDWVWAVLIGGLAAASPHTGSARLVPSLAGGVLVGALTFAARRGHFARWLPLRAGSSDASALRVAPRLPELVCVLAALVVCTPAVLWLWEQYTQSIWRNGHGLFLPVIVFCLARSELRGERIETGSDPWLAAPFLLVAVFSSWLGVNTHLGQIATLGIVFMVPGLCLLVLGREVTRRIALPLALLVFLIPMPEGLVDPIRLASATTMLMEPIVGVLGVRGIRVETIFAAPGVTFGVAANCSGLSIFYAASLLAIVLGWLARSWPVLLVLLASVWPITVFWNAIRVALLLVGAIRFGEGFVHTPVHGLSGIGTFWAVMISVGLLAYAIVPKREAA